MQVLRRRRILTALFAVIGAAILGWSLNVEPGTGWFYLATVTLAVTWAVSAVATGPVPLAPPGGRMSRRDVLLPVAAGLGLAGLFVVGGLIAREIAIIADAVDEVLVYARRADLPLLLALTVVTGIAEELFFRGALYAAVPASSGVAVSTAAYALATVASGNLVLGFAALVLGVVVGLERRASGHLLAPILTHVTWSTTMLLVLPAVFDG